MKKPLLMCLLLLAPGLLAHGSEEDAVAAVAAVLDQYHQAAAAADWESYFGLMSEDAVFLGTDVSERWSKSRFRDYAGGRSGWLYTPGVRNIAFAPDGNTAWFDEVLESASYGTSRGTGVLIKTGAGWKISQYHLTFPIPNALVRDFTDLIKAYENGQGSGTSSVDGLL